MPSLRAVGTTRARSNCRRDERRRQKKRQINRQKLPPPPRSPTPIHGMDAKEGRRGLGNKCVLPRVQPGLATMTTNESPCRCCNTHRCTPTSSQRRHLAPGSKDTRTRGARVECRSDLSVNNGSLGGQAAQFLPPHRVCRSRHGVVEQSQAGGGGVLDTRSLAENLGAEASAGA